MIVRASLDNKRKDEEQTHAETAWSISQSATAV